jgi:hypothetical protein
VNIFVVEPSRNSMSGVTCVPVSTFARPKPFEYTMRSPRTTAIAAPGVPVVFSSSRAVRSSSPKSTLC